jgi:hypothetical protein
MAKASSRIAVEAVDLCLLTWRQPNALSARSESSRLPPGIATLGRWIGRNKIQLGPEEALLWRRPRFVIIMTKSGH